MTSPRQPGQHRYRLTVLAGAGTLMIAIPFVAGHASAAALAAGIAVPVLILGLLFVLGARRRRRAPAGGGCHAMTAVLLQDPQSPPAGPISTGHPSPRTFHAHVVLQPAIGRGLRGPVMTHVGTDE